MAETREITLTDENWHRIDKLVAKIPDSDFLRFCLMNELIEVGMEGLEAQITIN